MSLQIQDSVLSEISNKTISELTGDKLPLKSQVLQLLFHKTKHEKIKVNDAVKLVIREVKTFWDKASLETRQDYHCFEQLKKLQKDFRSFQKLKNRTNNMKDAFVEQLNDVFDISHNSLCASFNESERNTLFYQTVDEIRSNLLLIKHHELRDAQKKVPLTEEDIEILDRTESLELGEPEEEVSKLSVSSDEITVIKSIGEYDKSTELQSSIELQSQSSEVTNSSPHQSSSGSVYSVAHGRLYEKKHSRGSIDVMTPEVVAAFDKCKISYRNSVFIISTIANALGFDIENLILNKSSFNKSRAKIREQNAEKVKKLLMDKSLSNLIVHWDGKLIPDRIQCKQIDRLPILISRGDIEKIIDVPGLEDQKGSTIGNAVYQALNNWGLLNYTQGLCCDTTPANFGHISGAAVILEQLIGRDLLYFACRHHMLEIILSAAFGVKVPGMNGPNVPIFQKFKKEWSTIQLANYENGLGELEPFLQNKITHTVSLIKNYLQTQQPRDDYKELLELSLLFLGAADNIQIRKPGACHHARWMAKAIYSLKIFLFRKSFKLRKHEENNFYSMCKFVVFVYIEPWFTAPLAIAGPNNDLGLIKSLIEYESIDANISKVTLNKLENHLWYLSPEICALSFFDERVPVSVKQKMVEALQTKHIENGIDTPKKYNGSAIGMKGLLDKELDFFINSQSSYFFERFGLNIEFLAQDCGSWSKNESFIENRKKVANIRVVNDCAERAVHLTQEYINILTNDEVQKNYLIQVVEGFRKEFPDANKKTVIKRLKMDN